MMCPVLVGIERTVLIVAARGDYGIVMYGGIATANEPFVCPPQLAVHEETDTQRYEHKRCNDPAQNGYAVVRPSLTGFA